MSQQRKATIGFDKDGSPVCVSLSGGAFPDFKWGTIYGITAEQAEEIKAAWESWGGVHAPLLVVGETEPDPMPCDKCGKITPQKDLWHPGDLDRLRLPDLGKGFYCGACFPVRRWPDDPEEEKAHGCTREDYRFGWKP